MEPTLKAALQGADRIRARTRDDCGFLKEPIHTLFTVDDEDEVRKIIDLIRIPEREGTGGSGSCDDVCLEFYAKDRLLVTLRFHFDRALRWYEGWPTEAVLTEENAEKFRQWLAKHGVKSTR